MQQAESFVYGEMASLARVAEAEAQKQRMSLIREAIRLEQEDKKAAGAERQRLESRRARLEHEMNVRRWALGQFEIRDRGRLPDVTQTYSRLQRWRGAHDAAKQVLLDFPNRSRGGVKTGRALNFFQGLCGGLALQHQLHRKQLRSRLKSLELDIERAQAIATPESQHDPADELPLHRLERERQDVKARLDLLDRLRGRPLLTAHHRGHLRFERGVTGGKLIISNRDGVLPLTWPSLLHESEAYGASISAMEAARASALDELREGQGISTETQLVLLDTADAIYNAYRRDRLAWMEEIRSGRTTPHRFDQYNVAAHFVQGLREGVSRFIEARDVEDVEPEKPFEGETVDSLMAYVGRNGLRFAPADRNGESAYLIIYQEMVHYYTELYGLRLAIEDAQEETQALDEKIDTLFQRQYANTMEALVQALEARPKRDFAEQFRDVALGVSGVFNAVNGGGAGHDGGTVSESTGTIDSSSAEFHVGDKVANAGLLRRWNGTIVSINDGTVLVRLDYVNTTFGRQYRRGDTYPFVYGEFVPLRSISARELLDGVLPW